MDSAPKVGDLVRVPWGTEYEEGRVTEVIEMSQEPWAQVEVWFEGLEKPWRVDFPVSMLEPVQEI